MVAEFAASFLEAQDCQVRGRAGLSLWSEERLYFEDKKDTKGFLSKSSTCKIKIESNVSLKTLS
jgi:hypothetical protein